MVSDYIELGPSGEILVSLKIIFCLPFLRQKEVSFSLLLHRSFQTGINSIYTRNDFLEAMDVVVLAVNSGDVRVQYSRTNDST